MYDPSAFAVAVHDAQDVERAHDVINTLRRTLAKYRDSRVALAEGYQQGAIAFIARLRY